MNSHQRAAAMRLADALDNESRAWWPTYKGPYAEAAVLLRELASEPVQEPVAVPAGFDAWWESDGQFLRAGGGDYEKTFAYHAWLAAHPQRQLTDEQIADVVSSFDGTEDWNLHDFARAIERAHGIGEQKT